MIYFWLSWLIVILNIILADIVLADASVPPSSIEQAKPRPRILFQASFDCNVKADTAEGNPVPLEAKGVQFRKWN